MNSKPNPWNWFTDRVLPGLFVATAIAVAGALWLTYNTTQQIVGLVAAQQQQMNRMETKIASLESGTASKAELASALQIVGQQIEIAMLKAGVKMGPVQPWRSDDARR